MKDLSTKTITTIIGMVSFLVFFIWGYFGSWTHSWLALMVGVMASMVVRMVRKDKEEAERKRREGGD